MTTTSDPAPQVTHYPNGEVKFKGFYFDGEMHGEWEWFRTDGSLMRTGAFDRFDRGMQIGVWRTFDRSGKAVKVTRFSQ